MSAPKSTFTDGNYRTFFGMAIDTLVKPWEKMLGVMKYTEVCPFYVFCMEANSLSAARRSQA